MFPQLSIRYPRHATPRLSFGGVLSSDMRTDGEVKFVKLQSAAEKKIN